jgi:hypothetical protein
MSADQAAQSQSEFTGESWLTPRRFAVLLGLLVLASFPAVLFGKATFVFRDFGLFSYPVAHYQRECFWRGELPLWNPYNSCGIPFLAQWNTMALYPPTLIYLLLPLTWSLPFFCLAHLYWGGLGTYFLAWHWTGNRLAAGLAGLIFSFNGLMLNSLMWPSTVATFSWVPWMVWLIPLAWRNGGKHLILGVVVGSMQMLAGAPETILLTWIILGLLAGCEWVRKESDRAWLFLRLGAVVGLVALICAAQLVPFLQLLAHSQRDSGFGTSGWEMPLWGWANFLVPVFGTIQTPQGVCLQRGQYWTSSYFAGIGTLWLAAVAVWRRPDWRARTLGCLLLSALVLALGNRGWLYRVLYQWVPVLGVLRYPVKMVILPSVLLPILAAFGLKSLLSEKRRISRFEWGVGVGLFVALAVIVAFGLHSTLGGPLLLRNAALRGVLLAITLAVVFAWLNASLTRRPWFGSVLLLAAWTDLLTQAPWQNPTAEPSIYAAGWGRTNCHWNPEPKLGESRAMVSADASQAMKYHSISSPDRTYLLHRLGLMANVNLLDEVPQAQGFFPLLPAEINDATAAPYVHTNLDFSPLMDFMGVSQTSAPGSPFEWSARSTAMPVVTAGQQPRFADDPTAFSAFYTTNADLRQVVFLPLEARGRVGAAAAAEAPLLNAAFQRQRISVQVRTLAPAMVVIAQTYYPGWKAYVDGKATTLWRANFAFQAVEVPAGAHVVTLEYKDRAFVVGLVGSLLGLCLTSVWWWRSGSWRTTNWVPA